MKNPLGCLFQLSELATVLPQSPGQQQHACSNQKKMLYIVPAPPCNKTVTQATDWTYISFEDVNKAKYLFAAFGGLKVRAKEKW